MRAFSFVDFAPDTIRLHKAGGGTEEPIYSQALVLEPRHGLPPPPPQIASRFAAQINLEGQEKIQATALCAVLGRGVPSDVKRPTGRGYNIYEMAFITRLKSGVSKQEATVAQLRSTVAQQQKGMEAVIAHLKEQDSKIQDVSTQIELNKPAPRTVFNHP